MKNYLFLVLGFVLFSLITNRLNGIIVHIWLGFFFVQDNFKTNAFSQIRLFYSLYNWKKRIPKIKSFHVLAHLFKLKAKVNFSDRLLSVASVHLSIRLSGGKPFTFSSSSPEPLGQFQPNLAQSSRWVKGIQVCSNNWPRPFPRGDNYEIAKIHWRN